MSQQELLDMPLHTLRDLKLDATVFRVLGGWIYSTMVTEYTYNQNNERVQDNHVCKLIFVPEPPVILECKTLEGL